MTDHAADTQRTTQLIVVGASAGGIEALLTLVDSLPADFPAPIVVAQHLDPNRLSHLGSLLAHRTSVTVRTVTDHDPLQAGTIYVVPSDRDVEITDHSVTVLPRSVRGPAPSIDRLLATAAHIFADRLIAVVLTGTGTDGAEGARAVKAYGGTVIVQNPETARFPGMPMAVASSTIDIVADLEAIGPLLVDLLSGAYLLPAVAKMSCVPSSITCGSGRDSISRPTSGPPSRAGCSGGWWRSARARSSPTAGISIAIPTSCNGSSPAFSSR